MAERPLTDTERAALWDCARFSIYWWKPATMARLAVRGLVECVPSKDSKTQLAYRITDAGRREIERESAL